MVGERLASGGVGRSPLQADVSTLQPGVWVCGCGGGGGGGGTDSLSLCTNCETTAPPF